MSAMVVADERMRDLMYMSYMSDLIGDCMKCTYLAEADPRYIAQRFHLCQIHFDLNLYPGMPPAHTCNNSQHRFRHM